MGSALVDVAAIKRHLNVTTTTDDTLLDEWAERATALLEADCAREDVPFAAAQTGRVEVHDGTGTGSLWLDYPIAAVTQVALGRDPGDPDDLLDATDPDEVTFVVGRRRLRRPVGTFGARGSPDYVRVTYTTQADQPRQAAAAVLDVVASIYRQRGTEGSARVRLPDVDFVLRRAVESSDLWQRAVASLRRPVVR